MKPLKNTTFIIKNRIKNKKTSFIFPTGWDNFTTQQQLDFIKANKN
jgi:hypothetical protein